MNPYPTLTFIDQALGPHGPGFVQDLDALSLERRARELTDEYWSETVWLTGFVPSAAFEAVCAALERDRLARNGTALLVVAPTESARIVTNAALRQCVAADASPGTPSCENLGQDQTTSLALPGGSRTALMPEQVA